MSTLNNQPLVRDRRCPGLVFADPQTRATDFFKAHAPALEDIVVRHGAVLVRGVELDDAVFQEIASSLPYQRMNYVYRSTPRTRVGPEIFTTTEYPPAERIPLHSENAYARNWPQRLLFGCIEPATTGGATPLAYLDEVTAALDGDLVDEMERRGVRYVRHYRPYVDLPWQIVFQTDNRTEVEAYCTRAGLDFRWLEPDVLRTAQTCQGVEYHPIRKTRVIFNQAHLFHVSSLGADRAQDMISTFGANQLPRHATYGDGGRIPTAAIEALHAAFNENAFEFEWRAGDVLLIDNMQLAHGRSAFTGSRRHLAALLQPNEA